MTVDRDATALAWVDGALLPRAEARVSIDDAGFRYGLACFETMLARHGRVFRLGQHLDRLDDGLRLFRTPPPPRAELERAVAATLEASGLSEASVRLSVSPGQARRPALPATSAPSIVVTVDALASTPPPPRLWVSDVRLDAGRPWRGAKVAQFAPHLLARAEAQDRGFDDALLLDHAGHVVEAATANLFLVVAGALVTPPLEDGPLPGVTRATAMEVAAALGVDVREASLTVDGLKQADAAFLTSSVAGLVPVASVTWGWDAGRRESWLPTGTADAVLRALMDGHEQLVETETSRAI